MGQKVKGGRRLLLKSGLGASLAGVAGIPLASGVSAQEGECVQVDLVESAEGDIKETVDSANKYSDEDRLISWLWGNWDTGDIGEDMTTIPYESEETGCEVSILSDISFDFEANKASVTVEVTECTDGPIELALVSYDALCGSDPTDPGWEGLEQTLWDSDIAEGDGEVTLSVALPPAEPGPGTGEVLNVDSDESFDSIQGAVDEAEPNQTLLVGPSNSAYEEDVTVDVEGLTIEGETQFGESIVEPDQTAFRVDADDVTIDGFTIRGGSATAIAAEGLEGILTVTNNVIEDFDDDGISAIDVETVVAAGNVVEDVGVIGINARQGGQATIEDNEVKNTDGNGIVVEELEEATVEDNDMENSAQSAIFSFGVEDLTVIENDVSTTKSPGFSGIELLDHGRATVSNNEIQGEWADGLVSEGTPAGSEIPTGPVTIEHNVIEGADDSGIFVPVVEADVEIVENELEDISFRGIWVNLAESVSEVTVADNELEDIDQEAIRLEGEGNATVRDNTIEDAGGAGAGAISLFTFDNADIDSNTVNDVGPETNALFVNGVDEVDIDDNTLTGTDFPALFVQAAESATVEENDVSDIEGDGFRFVSADGVDITGNSIAGPNAGNSEIDFIGISFDDCSDLEITENDISDFDTGILLDDTTDAETSKATQNNIVDNGDGVVNEEDDTFDATENWWGEENGPGGEGPGDGDSVSENVDFEPWLDAPFDEGGEPTSGS